MLTDGIVTLRAPEPGDVDPMYIIENDSSLWNDGVTYAPMSRKQLWDYVQNYDGNIFASGQLRLVIERCEDNIMAGVVDLYDYDRINRRAYVGIVIARNSRNNGVGGRVLKMLCDYCRELLGMKQLAAVVRIDNMPSKKIFENNGFKPTGVFPEWIKKGDVWTDAIHYQLKL